MALDGFNIVCLEPGADNPKKHTPPPEPEPPEGFVDNTVYIYREKLDKDGNKVLIGTMDGYPEGWDDPAKRKMTPGSRWENSKEVEEIMAKYDWAELWPQVQKLLEAGNSIREIAEELDIELSVLRAKTYREKRIAAERQTPEPEPAEAANQEPNRESQEPAGGSVAQEKPEITVEDVLQYEPVQKEQGYGPEDEEPIPYVPVSLEKMVIELRDDLNLERHKVAALEKKMELLASALPAGSRTSQENRLAKLLVAVFRELGDAGTA